MDKEQLPIKVVREIVSQIRLGVYRHGHRLPAERKLCQHYAVSRGTLRRALADLERMGAIQIRPQSGAYVRDIPKTGISRNILPKDVEHITLDEVVFARKAIELASIELAAERMTPGQLHALNDCIEQMQANVDNLPDYLQFDMRFHELLVKAGRNPALIAAFEAIAEYHTYSQVFSSGSETCEVDAIKHHRRIVSALSAGDARKSVLTLRRHFDSMIKQQPSARSQKNG